MISKRSFDFKAWSNDADNSALITEINYILQYFHMKKQFIWNKNNIS